MLIDTHSHLQGKEFGADFADVTGRARAAGVGAITLVGCDIADSRRCVAMAATDPLFRATAGVHPHAAKEWGDGALAALRDELLGDPAVVAVGEIGLDYHYDFSPRRAQHEAFIAQLALANAVSMPVVIHCREAYDEMLDILADFVAAARSRSAGAMTPAGIMHCYFGTPAQAEQFIAMGFVLGIGGACTFAKAQELHEVVRQTPIEHLVLETDAPYIAPVPHRGKRNEPAYLPLVVNRIAELKAMSPDEVAEQTTANARGVFRLD
jgi:TatD DNase family protein